LKKADFTGLDLTRRALANDTVKPPPHTTKSPTLDKLLAEGRGGVMQGKGFFDYGGRTPDDLFKSRDAKLLSLKRHLRKLGDI
jgi:3-hydroxybutyryl-CoA dehydrogenase